MCIQTKYKLISVNFATLKADSKFQRGDCRQWLKLTYFCAYTALKCRSACYFFSYVMTLSKMAFLAIFEAKVSIFESKWSIYPQNLSKFRLGGDCKGLGERRWLGGLQGGRGVCALLTPPSAYGRLKSKEVKYKQKITVVCNLWKRILPINEHVEKLKHSSNAIDSNNCRVILQ